MNLENEIWKIEEKFRQKTDQNYRKENLQKIELESFDQNLQELRRNYYSTLKHNVFKGIYRHFHMFYCLKGRRTFTIKFFGL